MTTEHDVLRDLEAALDVSPSPGFESRVRSRVKAESMEVPRWTWSAAITVAATAVLALVLVPELRMPSQHATNVPLAQTDSLLATPPTTTPVAPPQVVRRIGPHPDVTRSQPQAVGAYETEPEVIVPAGQMEAIRRLAAAVAGGRVVAAPAVPGPPAALQVAAIDPAAPIAFEPMSIKPLSPESSPDLWR